MSLIESKNEEEDEEDTLVPLNEEEEAIKAYLAHYEALPDETVEKFVNQFWHDEPYKWVLYVMLVCDVLYHCSVE